MPRIVCRYIDCVYLENGVCGADSILLDPDEGCLTYSSVTDLEVEDEWEDELDGFVEEEDDEQGMLYEDDEEDDDWIDAEELV